MTIKVSIICTTDSDLETLSKLDCTDIGVDIFVHVGSAQTVASVIQMDQPDYLLLDLPLSDELSMQWIETALTESPGTHMAVVSPDRSVEFLTKAMRSGVREVMSGPMSPLTVQLAVKNARLKGTETHHPARRRGKVFALIPSKGGAGATFLATNLAYTLSKMDKRVLVLDLNLYFGDASIFLGDKTVVSTVVDLASQAQRLDPILLDSAMIKLSENLHILPAPELPGDLSKVSTQGIEKIIDIARNQYDFVIIDVSSNLDDLTLMALDMADGIYMTLQLNLPFIRAAKHMATIFQSRGYALDKLKLILNRYQGGGTIDLEDVENATKLKVYLTIPNSHTAVSESINQGIPLLELAPRDPVSRALQKWSHELVPVAIAPFPNGWLHKLIKAA